MLLIARRIGESILLSSDTNEVELVVDYITRNGVNLRVKEGGKSNALELRRDTQRMLFVGTKPAAVIAKRLGTKRCKIGLTAPDDVRIRRIATDGVASATVA